MSDVSFQVKQDALAVIQNTVIEANFDECKAALEEMMQPYKTLVVTEDGIAAAKSDRARIRKVASGIDDMRKTVKAAYSAPLKEFEEKCRKLTAICDEGAENLDRQVKEYEEREKAEKIARIRAAYDEWKDRPEYEFLPWDALYNSRWGNNGVSEESAITVIKEAFRAVGDDLATIRSMDQEDVPYLLEYYKGNQSIREVIRKANELKARREAEIQRRAAAELSAKKREEEERHREEQRQEQRQEADVAVMNVRPVGEVYEVPNPKDRILSITFRATGTREQFEQLRVFMQSLGMGLHRV